MTTLSKTSVKALAVLAAVCIPLFAYELGRDKSAGTASQKQSKYGFHSEPEIAAASPVSAQSWTTLADIKNPRFESSAVQYRDDLYVFNGFGLGIDVEPTVEKFDAGTQKWSVIGTTSIAKGNAVTHNGVIKHGNEVWMIGGRVGDHPGKVTPDVWIYNLATGNWSAGPKLPVPVAAGGAALVDNRIHWFGGLDPRAQCDVANHYVYDLDKPSAGWKDISGIAPMPMPRNHFATVAHEGLIYAIGGQFTHDGCRPGNPNTNLVHVFNPKTNTWTQKANLPAIQSHIEPSTFVHLGAIYVVGGAIKGDKVYRYDPSKDNWDTVAVLPRTLLAPVARVIDGKLIVSSGGAPGTTPGNKTYATDMTPLLLPGASNTNAPDSSDFISINNLGEQDTSFDDSEGLVILEAEYSDTQSATATHQWEPINTVGASNNAAMVTTPDKNTLAKGAQGSPSLSYFAYFDRPGTWYLWVRGSGDTVNGEGASDSLHAGLNGSLSNTADKIDNFPTGWNWSSSTRDGVRASLTIPAAGIHAVNLWMREDGLAVDKILLTTDSSYQPTGIGDTPPDNAPSPGNEVVAVENTNSENGTTSKSTQATNEVTAEIITQPGSNEGNSDSTTETTPPDSTGTTANDANQETAITDNATDNSETTNGVASNNGIIAIEVENFDSTSGAGNKQWIRSTQSDASGNAAMVTNPDTGSLKNTAQGSPVMNYRVYFDEAGTYTVWLRGWGDTVGNEGKSDSAHVGINGTLGSAAGIQNFPSQWHWSSDKRSGGSATIFVPSAGHHTINIWMREDGLILDKLILAKSAAYRPSGLGSDVTQFNVVTADNNGSSDDGTITNSINTETNAEPATQTTNDATPNENLISVEVENYASKSADGAHQWLQNNKSGASGSAMSAAPNTGKLSTKALGSATMNYPLQFAESGTYVVWLRGFGDSNGKGKNDSVYVGINGNQNTAQVMDSFPDSWSWSNKKRGGGIVTVSIPTAGQHTINLSMREDGIILDKIILTKDTTLIPGDSVSNTNLLQSLPVGSEDTSSNTNSATTPNFSNNWVTRNTTDGSTVQKRHEAGGVSLNGKLYVIGGRGTRQVSVYDPTTNKWSQKKAPPVELHHFQPIAFNNKIWILGAFTGSYPNETPVTDIYSYTPVTNAWAKEGTVPLNRRRGSTGAALHQGYIYLFGGNTNGHNPGAKAWLDRFNPTTGEWQTLPDAPTARDHITVSASNNKLVVAAGRQSAFPNVFANTISTTHVFDFNTLRWSTAESIPTQRAGAMTVTVGQEVVVIGGEVGNDANAKTTVESYNVVSDTWQQLSPLNIGRHSGAAAVLNNEMHVISGSEKRGGAPESTTHEVMKF